MQGTPDPTQIDVPDLDSALAGDADGSFHEKVRQYLAHSLDKIKAQAEGGLPTEEYEAFQRLQLAVSTADDVMRFSLSERGQAPKA